MANFVYKENRTRRMTLKGILDVDEGTILIDEDEKNLATLLSGFNGAFVDLTINVSEDEDLEEPVD
jgi:hypothetical protein